MPPISTELLLLQDRIDFLSNSFNWVIGSIGIVVTLTIVLVGYYVKQTNTKEIERIKKEAKELSDKLIKETVSGIKEQLDAAYAELDKIKTSVQETADKMHTHVDGKHSEMEALVHEFKNSAQGNIARVYAITNEERKQWGHAFTWWLEAAVCYSENDSSKLRNIAIQGARSSLEKIKAGEKVYIDALWEHMTGNCELIERLGKKHKNVADLIQEMMMEKAKLPKEKPQEQ